MDFSNVVHCRSPLLNFQTPHSRGNELVRHVKRNSGVFGGLQSTMIAKEHDRKVRGYSDGKAAAVGTAILNGNGAFMIANEKAIFRIAGFVVCADELELVITLFHYRLLLLFVVGNR